jgi:hypothetical protein
MKFIRFVCMTFIALLMMSGSVRAAYICPTGWTLANPILGPGALPLAFPLNGVASNGAITVAVGAGLDPIISSTDSFNWVQSASPFQPPQPPQTFTSVVWGGNKFVAVGTAGSVIYSFDGIVWTAVPGGVGTIQTLWSVTWSPALGLYVTVGGNGEIWTSPDGLAWTQQSVGVFNELESVTWSPALGIFVAVGLADPLTFAETVVTSPDGITWTAQVSVPGFGNDLLAVTWGKGMFVAVGPTGVINTSPDGITWTDQPQVSIHDFSALTFGNGLFVAGGQAGELWASPDGIIWFQEPTAGGWIEDVTWNGTFYIAVSSAAGIQVSKCGGLAPPPPTPGTTPVAGGGGGGCLIQGDSAFAWMMPLLILLLAIRLGQRKGGRVGPERG